jgi:hypothetical protein
MDGGRRLGDWLIEWVDGRRHYETDNREEMKEDKRLRHQAVIIYLINMLTVEVVFTVTSYIM